LSKQKKGSAPAGDQADEVMNEAPAEETAAQNEPETPAAEEKTPEQQLSEALTAEKDKYMRLAAEYDNFRKRSQKEREAVFSDARADTVLKLLPVYDNLSRALAQECTDAAFYKGVEMTMAQLQSILEKMNITEIPAIGETFDPAVHNAVMHIDDEKYGECEIVMEFEKGFKMGDKVIRFSAVQVAN